MRNRLILISVLCFGCSLAEASSVALERWAILVTPELETTGLADLLTAELSQHDGLELVERQQISAVLGELTLDAALGADATQTRLELTRLLKADALLILSLVKNEQQSVQVLVADSAYGARLRIALWPYSAERGEQLVGDLKELIDATRVQYASGVQRIIGIPDFVSRNLTHDLDYLQTRLAYLLHSGCVALPGYAVIEIDEAQAIGRELQIAGETLDERPVPLFIEGEFRHADRGSSEEAAIHLTLHVKENDRVLEKLEREFESTAAAAAWLQAEAPTRLLRAPQASPGALMSKAQQAALLSQRADVFAHLGDYQRSTALREAAVLLTPDDMRQRQELVVEYGRQVSVPLKTWLTRDLPGHVAFESWIPETVHNWQLGLDHLAYMIRKRAITREKLYEVWGELHLPVADLASAFSPEWQATRYADRVSDANWARLEEGIRRVEKRRRRFVRESVPLIGELAPIPATWKLSQWSLLDDLRDAVHCTINPGRSWRRDFPNDLEALACFAEALQAVGPTCPELSWSVPAMTLRYVSERENIPTIPDQDFVAFLDTLCASDRSDLQFAGKISRVVWQFCKETDQGAAALDEAFAAIAQIEDEYLSEREVQTGRQNSRLNRAREGLRRIAHGKHPFWNRVGWSPSREYEVTIDPLSRFSVELLSWRLQRYSGKIVEAGQDGFLCYDEVIHCGPQLDIVWSRSSIAIQREVGELHEVGTVSRGRCEDVAWDGQNLWIAVRETGVFAGDVDLEHVVAARADKELPPCDQGIKLHPISPGRALVAGSFGEQRRAWVAILELKGETLTADVIHEATRAVTHSNHQDIMRQSSAAAFVPQWIKVHRFQNRFDQPTFLIARGWNESGWRGVRADPLVVDLERRHVNVLPMGDWARNSKARLRQLRNGDYMAHDWWEVVHVAAPRHTCASGKSVDYLIRKDWDKYKNEHPQLVPYYDYVYIVDDPILRFDPRTGQTEQLGPHPLREVPNRYSNAGATMGGLLTWEGHGPYYRLTVDGLDPGPVARRDVQNVVVCDAESGGPLADAWVEVEYDSLTCRGVTDQTGKWPIEWPATEPLYLSVCAWKEGYAGDEVLVRGADDLSKSGGCVTVLLPRLTEIGGTIQTDDGQPMADAAVFLHTQRRAGTLAEELCDYLTYTNEDGTWREHVFPEDVDGIEARAVPAGSPKQDLYRRTFSAGEIEELIGLRHVWVATEPAAPAERSIKGYVVDETDDPLSGARVFVPNPDEPDQPLWEAVTDNRGVFEWPNAPVRDLPFRAEISGYVQAEEATLPAHENTCVLHMRTESQRVLFGTVVDVSTGEPVQEFTLLFDGQQGERPVSTKRSFKGGEFELPLGPGVHGTLKVSAARHFSKRIEISGSDESRVELRVELEPGRGLSGTLLLADGSVAHHAHLHLIRNHLYAREENEYVLKYQPQVSTTTDAEGRFEFSPDIRVLGLLAFNDYGAAVIVRRELEESGQLVLQPWGRIEGTCEIETRSLAGQEVGWAVSLVRDKNRPPVQVGHRVAADENGHFVLEKVPAGPVEVQRFLKLVYGYSEGEPRTHSVAADVPPGETVHVVIRPLGRPAVGRIVGYAGFDDEDASWLIRGELHTPEHLFHPENWESLSHAQKKRWRWEFRASEASNPAVKRYPMYFKPDGSFRIDDVVPGEYCLTIRKLGQVMLEKTVVVPATPGEAREPFDLGEFPWEGEPSEP